MDVPGEKLLEPKVVQHVGLLAPKGEKLLESKVVQLVELLLAPKPYFLGHVSHRDVFQVDMADMLRSLATQKPTGVNNFLNPFRLFSFHICYLFSQFSFNALHYHFFFQLMTTTWQSWKSSGTTLVRMVENSEFGILKLRELIITPNSAGWPFMLAWTH